MPTDLRYDPAGKPSASTNRLNPKLAGKEQRVSAQVVGDARVTVATSTLTVQFYDMLCRPFKGNVMFLLSQVNGVISTPPTALGTTGRLPAVGATTNGTVLSALTANKHLLAMTDANGLFVCTLGGVIADGDAVCAAALQMFSSGAVASGVGGP